MKWLRGISRDSRDAFELTAGRTFGFAVSFAIPLVLVRVLDQQDFGIYKYLFLISTTLSVLQLGLAESLYYFVPRAKEAAGRVIANAAVMLLGIGSLVVALALTWPGPMAELAGAPGIRGYLPELAIFLAGVLLSMPLEIAMVSRRKVRTAALTYATSDVVRAVLLVTPGLAVGTLEAIMAGAVSFGLFRIAATGLWLTREFGRSLRPERSWARGQIAYAAPFAVAVIIEVTQINLHQFIVWGRFDAATFAVYAAGCLQVPIVDLLHTSVGNVLMVRMADGSTRAGEMLRLWHQAVVRLGRVLLPLGVALLLTAHDLIVLLFTRAYEGSVPVFMVSTLAVALATFPVDSVLRAWAQVRFLIVMNLVRLGVVLAGIWWAMAAFGLPGAMLVTVLGLAAAKLVAIVRIGRTLEAGPRLVLPWRALGGIALAAAVAVLPALALRPLLPDMPLVRGGLTAAVYGASYLGLSTFGHVAAMKVTAARWRAAERL